MEQPEGVTSLKGLSRQLQSLWAKKDLSGGLLLWLPLVVHMADSAAVAQRLWNRWVPDGVKQAIERGISEEGCAERLFVFLSAVHDLGKATPVFQSKPSRPPCRELDELLEAKLAAAGLPIRPGRDFHYADKTPHALATQILLEYLGCHRSVAVIPGSHHGRPPSLSMLLSSDLESYSTNYHLEEAGRMAWTAVWNEIIGMALGMSGFSDIGEIPKANMTAQVLLSALIIVVDWLASNRDYFPYIRPDDSLAFDDIQARTARAWKDIGLPSPWRADNTWMRSNLYLERFGLQPRQIQSCVFQIARDIKNPGILVLEAPMGSGKTEAALACAEVFADKTKRTGVFFALPTQATSDGVFPRMLKWAGRLDSLGTHSIRLAHGKAQFNEAYQDLKLLNGNVTMQDYEDIGVAVHEWFEGQKKALLADFVVGTVDQLLMAALKQKHVMLRHLGLAGKVVIIDECHAYDAYMGQYLIRALNWLGAYGVPVIVLSATLPAKRRREIIDAYLNTRPTLPPPCDSEKAPQPLPTPSETWFCSRDYPLVTWTDGPEVKQKTISLDDPPTDVGVEFLDEHILVDKLEEMLSDGGCAGVIVNTVRRAQEFAALLSERFGKETVRLLHSRFLAPDRRKKEREILEELGSPSQGRQRPFRRIVVGTQVLEQSLDIDFDVLATDICPMDLLLQRIGRLHRHRRPRPHKLSVARCLIMGVGEDGFEPDAESIYGEYFLIRTRALLPDRLVLPRDISRLVQATYDDEIGIFPEPSGYSEARKKKDKVIADKEKRAKDFRLGPIWPGSTQTLAGWLDTDVPSSEKHGEAAVRDSEESIEVLLVRDKGKGQGCVLLGATDGPVIPENLTPDEDTAREIARQAICLPRILCTPWAISRTIIELEQISIDRLSEWQRSPWLKGELILILDEENSASLGGYRLTYDKDYGLLYRRETDNNE